MVSNRSRARAKARRLSNASASRHSMLVEPVECRIGRPALQRLAARVERQDACGAAGQVHRERAVIGEAVERPTARMGEPPGEQPVLPLVEEGAGLLACPGVGEVSHAAFPHLDALGDRAVERGLEVCASPSRLRTGTSFRSRMPSGSKRSTSAPTIVVPHRLEARREELHHQPAVVAVHHQRGQTVAFAMHEAEGVRIDAGRAVRPRRPGARATRCRPRPGRVALEEAQPDFGGGSVEGLADEAAARVVDRDHTGGRGLVEHLAPVDPGMARTQRSAPRAVTRTAVTPGRVGEPWPRGDSNV